MCGIVGYWNLRSGRPADSATIERMTESLVHRGPDDSGTLLDGALALGMRRLSVVDLPGGHQPMSNEDGSVHVVFNGEIYDHALLREELVAHGHRFRTRSDTEVLVHGFEQWGPDFLERLNGMFALAIWDARQRRLLLARDRLGIKPLYVHDGPEGVVFASELKAIVRCPWVPLEFDLEAVDDFMTYEYVPAPRSIVRGVGKLPPAHALLYEQEGHERPIARRYWQLEHRPSPHRDARTAARELRERLLASVRRRQLADVPLGAFLSGGIDSSAIVGLMAGERSAAGSADPIRTFSLGFAEASYDEREYARLVSRHFGTRHEEGIVGPEIVDLSERVSAFFDEPFADVSAFPMLMLSELARRDVTVVLSGDGGDELFAGYDHYKAHRWSQRLRWLLRGPGWWTVERLLDRLPPAESKKGPANLAKRFAEGLRRPADLEQARWWVFWDLDQRRALYDPQFARGLGDRDCFGSYRALLREGAERGFEGLQRQLYADLMGYLPDDILTKVDRMSMAVSLEARVPFLDHEFVEFAMALPADWKLAGMRSKWILRESMRDFLPSQVLQRRKEGFSIPLKNWLRGPLRPLLHDLLGRLGERGWFDRDEVERLLTEHLDGRENHAHRLWCLSCLELSLEGLERSARERARGQAGPTCA